MNILIIDNYDLFTSGLVSLLEKNKDHEVLGIVNTKEDVVRLFQTKEPEIIFIDTKVLSLDNLELIKAYEYHTNIKFVIFTTEINYFDLKKYDFKNVYGIILKTAPIEEIVFGLNLIKKNRKYYDPYIYEFITNKNDNSFVDELTEREINVLEELTNGLNNQQIAEKLYISISTVKKHVSQILNKLNVDDRTQAALYYKNRINIK